MSQEDPGYLQDVLIHSLELKINLDPQRITIFQAAPCALSLCLPGQAKLWAEE